MANNLILNPNLKFEFVEEETAFYLSAPKAGDSLKRQKLTGDEHKDLFEIFSELSQNGLNFLDIEKDLSDDERELFVRNGVLVEKETVVPKPLCKINTPC